MTNTPGGITAARAQRNLDPEPVKTAIVEDVVLLALLWLEELGEPLVG
jgi:hypothetical protein